MTNRLRLLHSPRAVEDDVRVMTVAVSGEVDLATMPRLTDVFDAALRARPDAIVVDLTEVTFFGSVGVRSLLTALDHACLCGVRLILCCSPTVERVLSLTETLRLFDVVDAPS